MEDDDFEKMDNSLKVIKFFLIFNDPQLFIDFLYNHVFFCFFFWFLLIRFISNFADTFVDFEKKKMEKGKVFLMRFNNVLVIEESSSILRYSNGLIWYLMYAYKSSFKNSLNNNFQSFFAAFVMTVMFWNLKTEVHGGHMHMIDFNYFYFFLFLLTPALIMLFLNNNMTMFLRYFYVKLKWISNLLIFFVSFVTLCNILSFILIEDYVSDFFVFVEYFFVLPSLFMFFMALMYACLNFSYNYAFKMYWLNSKHFCFWFVSESILLDFFVKYSNILNSTFLSVLFFMIMVFIGEAFIFWIFIFWMLYVCFLLSSKKHKMNNLKSFVWKMVMPIFIFCFWFFLFALYLLTFWIM